MSEAYNLGSLSELSGVSNKQGDERARRPNGEPVRPKFRSLGLKHVSPRSIRQTRQHLMDRGCMDCLTTILLGKLFKCSRAVRSAVRS